MISLAVGLLLIASLLLAHLWVRTDPLKKESPLDVDENLPAPWVGHASSVFSLTALFGAYLAILVILGPVAIVGVALGGISSLFLLRVGCERAGSKSFEGFLKTRRYSEDQRIDEFFFFLVAITQMGFAISELVILRDLSVHAFAMAPRHATVFAIAVALIAYLYSLVGGYGAVFRTDILQFGFVVLMCATIAFTTLPTLTASQVLSLASPLASGYWSFGLSMPRLVERLVNFIVGFLTGACFLAASPDTWKRVHMTSSVKHRRSFYLLAIAGALPFILLIPAALLVPKVSLATISPFAILYQAGRSRPLLLIVTLGLISAFMSSFDSALITTIHLSLMSKQRRSATAGSLSSFHYTAGICFAAIVAGALALISALGNSYFLAAFLLSLYSIVGGGVLGTRILSKPVSGGKFLWLAFGVLVAWFMYLVNIQGVLEKPKPEQIKAFPLGMLVFCFYAAASFLGSRRRGVKREKLP